MGKRQCELEGCTKQAASGGTPHCVAHGGGERCQEEDCIKSARGDTEHCIAHGGGRRCQHDGFSQLRQQQAPDYITNRLRQNTHAGLGFVSYDTRSGQ
jgi:hypothetical protein